MMYTCEGIIEIPIDDFEEWLLKSMPKMGGVVVFGVPTVNKSNLTIDVAFAVGDEAAPPQSWAKKPLAVTEWDRRR